MDDTLQPGQRQLPGPQEVDWLFAHLDEWLQQH
jgi:hypothetical protein